MLYPDFDDLVTFKNRKTAMEHPSRRSVKSTVKGNHHSPFRGQGLEFDSVREYVPGDDIRCIDWRVTARTGSPHLKIFKEERERQIVICVDMNASMRFGTRNTFKSVQAARVAALLGWGGILHHDRVGSYLFGDVPSGIQFFAPKSNKKPFSTMLKTLTQAPVERHQISFEEVLKQVSKSTQNGALVYMISDFMEMDKNFQSEAELNRLNKRCDIVFISINDQADKSMYPLGMVGFCGNSVDKIYVNTESVAGRKTYEAQWEANRKQLYELTSRVRIPVIELTTESNISSDLIMGLKKLTKGARQ